MAETKLCKRCGLVKSTDEFQKDKTRQDGLQVYCKACTNAANRQSYNKHAPEVSEQRKNNYQEHKEEVNERNRRYYHENIDKQHERSQRYYQAHAREIQERRKARLKDRKAEHQRYYQRHRSIINEKNRQYLKTHPEKQREAQYRYRKAHPDKVRLASHIRRSRKQNVPGCHTVEDVKRQYDYQNGCCWWCSVPLPDKWHEDHVIALTRGGPNWPENIVCACPSCNLSKRERIPYIEWQPPNPLYPPSWWNIEKTPIQADNLSTK